MLGIAVWIDRKPGDPVMVGDLRNPLAGSNNPLDRLAYTVADPVAAGHADLGLYGGPTLPLLFALYPTAYRNTGSGYGQLLLVWLEAMLLNFAVTSLIKNVASRPRPYVLNENFSPLISLSRNDRAAFLSGHASNAAVGSTLFALLFTLYFKNRTLILVVWSLAGGMQGLTGYLRVKAAKHWPTDALAGVFLGQVVARAIFRVHYLPMTLPQVQGQQQEQGQ